MDIKVFFGVLILVLEGIAIRDELSMVDELRKTLINKTRIAQMFITRGTDLSYIDIVGVYNAFGDLMDEQFPPEQQQNFTVLNKLSLWRKMKSNMEIIDNLYAKFRSMQKDLFDDQKLFDIEQWSRFTEAVLNDPIGSVSSKLNQMTEYMVHQRLFFSAYEAISSEICDVEQSPQQLLYNLYKTIALTEMKGFAVMQFSYTLLRLRDKKNYTMEMQSTEQDYATRLSETLRHVKLSMAYSSRDIWRCDPEKHKEGKTFYELKEVFQGYIVNEVDLNIGNSCRENCAYYSYTKVHGCYANQYCAQQTKCKGKILNCQYIDSDMDICPSAKGGSRRYDYIEYENGRVLGNKGKCTRGTTKVDSWWRWLFWHCSYCFCYCDDQTSGSDRYFNLRDVTSNIDQNKVIVGVRLVKSNHIFHIQIKEGVLFPKGTINPNSVTWKPIDNYTIHDSNVKKGIDYHALAWEKRALDLDDLVPPTSNQLLTGLRFKLIGAHLNLEIRTTEFNFTTGKLMAEKSRWHSNDNTDADGSANGSMNGPRVEVILNKPDIPTHFYGSTPDSSSNQYLHFQPTDLNKDAAQSTVPFIDIQPVEPEPPTLIFGAGIFHKGRVGSGGFVALKLITYDFSKHLKADLPTHTETVVIGLSNEINAV